MAHRRLDWKVALALGVAGVWLGRRLTRRRYDLRGKTVLICGGARGFGLALARAFGARGGRLALLADITRDATGLDLEEERLPRRIRMPSATHKSASR